MAIIKQKEIYDDSKKVFDKLNAELDILIKKEGELITQNKALQQSYKDLQKTNDGVEAKKLIDNTEKLKKTTTELTAVQKQRLAVKKQLQTTFAKALIANEKQNKILAKGKVRLQEQNKALKQNAREALGLVGAYEKLTKKVNDAQKNLKNLAAQFGVNSKQARKAQIQFDKVEKELRGVNNAAKDGRRDVGRYGLSLKGVAKSLIGSLGVVGGMMAFVNVLKNAFKISVEFGKASSGLAAILQKTKGEITTLTDQAKDLGATTAFTATEVIKLQTELARLGFELDEIKDSTPAILDLGAALGVNLADAAQVAGGVVRAFNLSTKDTKEVVDSMVATLNNSGAAFEDYREAVSVAAPIFKAANIDFKTMNLLIGKLADSQIKGSKAGTGLKNLVSKLSDENSKLSKELGFTVKNSDDLVKAFELLKTKNIDLTDATELTDERSKAAFLTLIQGVDSADKLSVALNNLDDNAKKTAATMLDNLAGDITLSQSAWAGFVLSLSDGTGVLSSKFRSLTQTWTEFLGGLQKLNEEDISTQMKVIANGIITTFDAITLGNFDKALKNITGEEDFLRFNTDKTTVSLKGQKNEIDRNVKSTGELVEEIKKSAAEIAAEEKARKKSIAALQKHNKALQKQADLIQGKGRSVREETGGDRKFDLDASPGDIPLPSNESAQKELDFLDDQNTKKLNQEKAFQHKILVLRKETPEQVAAHDLMVQEQLDAQRVELAEITATAIKSLLTDIATAGIDERLAERQVEFDAEEQLLQNKLDKGLISEEAFQKGLADIDKRSRIATAKAEKKKALFSIAIDTAVAIVKALATPWLIPGILLASGIQAAAVAAAPLPKFGEGGEIEGNSHDQGSVNINAEGGEYMLRKSGYEGAEGISEMINKGLIKDEDIGMMKNSGNYNPSILQLNGLSDIKRNTHQTNEYLKHMYSSHENSGMIHFKNAYGKSYSVNKINRKE